MKTIYIREEPTELYKILKFENLVYGGGEAKLAISEGYVLLNGEVETQKRKKIVSGDIIEFDQKLYEIKLEQQNHDSTQLAAKQQNTLAPKQAVKPKRTAIKF